MKLAIISDTHFGSPSCQLVQDCALGPKYNALKQALQSKGPLDYLVLAGDVLDFSVAPYEQAFAAAQVFFQAVLDDGLLHPDRGQFIYLAGNHDADIWHIMQFQRSVINRVINGKLPEALQHSVPAILDDRSNSPTAGLTLHGVKPNASGQYGGMFLDHIAAGATFNFAYPNLYIATDSDCVLVTHGQYLEAFWAALGDIVYRVAQDDLGIAAMDIESMVALNFPINQLSCTGVGQAGVFTKNLVLPIEREIKAHDLARAERYLNRLQELADERLVFEGFFGFAKEFLTDQFLEAAKENLLSSLQEIKYARYDAEYCARPAVKQRMERFFQASQLELQQINSRGSKFADNLLPAIQRILFGHTHWPIAYADVNPITLGGTPLYIHNSGGWLVENGKFCGAEIFAYETGIGFGSVTIS